MDFINTSIVAYWFQMSSRNEESVYANYMILQHIGFRCLVATNLLLPIDERLLQHIGFRCLVATARSSSSVSFSLQHIGFRCLVATSRLSRFRLFALQHIGFRCLVATDNVNLLVSFKLQYIFLDLVSFSLKILSVLLLSWDYIYCRLSFFCGGFCEYCCLGGGGFRLPVGSLFYF